MTLTEESLSEKNGISETAMMEEGRAERNETKRTAWRSKRDARIKNS